MKVYEGMFLVDPTQAATKWNEVLQHVKDLITKYGGKVLQANKWAEHKLAYPVKHQRRGVYILTYFEAPPESITKINADVMLSEIILRAMILIKPKELPKSGKPDTPGQAAKETAGEAAIAKEVKNG